MPKRCAAVLNAGAGTLRNRDASQVAKAIEGIFRSAGHRIEVIPTEGRSVGEQIKKQARREDLDVVIVGGGDGTVSAAAGYLQGGRTGLGVLPLGTLNLFARSLGVPLELEAAATRLAHGHITEVDVGSVNGRTFVHQVSFGLQPKLVKLREEMDYGSRMGKLLASGKAFLLALREPPRLALRTEIDGTPVDLVTPALVVSNNVFTPGHAPYAERLNRGLLGVYVCTSTHWRDIAQVTADALLGNWDRNPQVSVHTATQVAIERRVSRRALSATVDGELVRFHGPITVEIVPRSLRVLVPETETVSERNEPAEEKITA
jgi:diacylglycerol kinase family enzyme